MTRLLHLYFVQVDLKDQMLSEIDNTLRTYMRDEVTIDYNEELNVLNMIDILIRKDRKEKEVHYVVQKKEESLMNRYDSKLKVADE